MTELIIFIGIPVALATFIILIYNGIVGRFNAVERAWASVLTQERQKNKIIPAVEKMVEDYKLHEGGLLTEVTKLRSAIQELQNGEVNPQKLSVTEQLTSSLLQGLKVTVEAYPELKASDVYLKVMAEISEQQEQIAAAIRIFNQNVEDFNNGIQMFPGSLVNSFLNKKSKVETFSDSQASSGFDYKPNV